MSKIFIDERKVGQFLKALRPEEFIYLKQTVVMRDSLQQMINKFKLSKEDFCSRFKLPANKYKDFVLGNYNYSLRDIATMESYWHELKQAGEIEHIFKVAEHPIFKDAIVPEAKKGTTSIIASPAIIETLKPGDVIFAVNPKSKKLTDGSAYNIEWKSAIGSFVAVKNDDGEIRPYSINNFRLP